MNWGRIKTIFIAVLVIVNLYLGISMLIRYRETTYIDDEVQEMTSSIAGKWGLNISKETIPDVRPSGVIYEYSFSAQDYCIAAAKRMFGKNSNTSTYIFSDGIKVVSESGAQSVYFTSGTGDIFGFEYKADDQSTAEADYVASLKVELPNVDFYDGIILDGSSNAVGTANAVGTDTDGSDASDQQTASGTVTGSPQSQETAADHDGALDFPALRKLTISGGNKNSGFGKSAADFIMPVICGASETEQSTVSVEIYNIIKESNSKYTVVTLGLNAGGKKINGCGAICVFRTDSDGDTALLYANGSMIFALPDGEYESALRDQINIIFDERDFICGITDADEAMPGTVPGVISGAETGSGAGTVLSDTELPASDAYEIKSMTVIYCVNWNSAMTKFYLIPAWRIAYTDGTVRIRNAINGGIYR